MKNKYELNKDSHLAAKTILAEVTLRYDMKADAVDTVVALRHDVENDALLLRIGQQFENALRTVMPPYRQEMELLEKMAELSAANKDCSCAKTS